MLIAQIFGFGAIGSSLLIYTRKKRESILWFKLIQDLCWATHYLLLGAYSAMATNLICATREVVFRSKNPEVAGNKLILTGYLFFFVTSALLTWKNAFSIFPAMSSCFSTIAFHIKRPWLMKLMVIPSALCTLVYNIAVSHSMSVYVGLCITLSTLCYSLIREAIKKRKNERNEEKKHVL